MNWIMMNFQDSNSLMMEKMIFMYDFMIMTMSLIMIMIIYIIVIIINNKYINKSILEKQNLETLWTMYPLMLIIIMSMMSIKILYLNNEFKINIMSIKIISNQWFWYYEYMNFNIKFNSYILINNSNFNFYLLENNNKLIIPFNYQIQIIITSMDVIHSWTIPSMNIKMDSIPNHLNYSIMFSYKPTIMFGQCSELCGMNHSLMPIMIENININMFNNWMMKKMNL